MPDNESNEIMTEQIAEPDNNSIDDNKMPEATVEWESNAELWEIVSDSPGGFDRVFRYDYKAANSVANIHERATGNFVQINCIQQ